MDSPVVSSFCLSKLSRVSPARLLACSHLQDFFNWRCKLLLVNLFARIEVVEGLYEQRTVDSRDPKRSEGR